MKKLYNAPDFEFLAFLLSDVITDSPDDYAEDIFDISQNVGTESGDDIRDDQFGADPTVS